MTHMKRFVVISRARSGSTMLGSMLGAHPQVVMHGEIFGAHHYPLNFYGINERLPWPTPLELCLKRIRDSDARYFLDSFVYSETARACVGFKFKFEEFDLWPVVLSYIVENNISVILLNRQKLFARYLSEIKAINRGRFNTNDNVQFGGRVEGNIDRLLSKERIEEDIDKSLKYYRLCEELFCSQSMLKLSYEDFTSDMRRVSSEIYAFLDIENIDLEPSTKKISSEHGESDSINIDGIRSAFQWR